MDEEFRCRGCAGVPPEFQPTPDSVVPVGTGFKSDEAARGADHEQNPGAHGDEDHSGRFRDTRMTRRDIECELTVAGLIALLQQYDPDLPVRIPCPHCCGHTGADFDPIVAEFVQQSGSCAQPVILLGDPRQRCLLDALRLARQEHTAERTS